MKKPTKTFLSYSILSVTYVLLVLLVPPNDSTLTTYNLNTAAYKILALMVAVPRLIVWFAAFYGYDRLDSYSTAIKKTADGKAFSNITSGLRWLAWGLPISAIASASAGGITHEFHGFLAFGLIFTHYLTLFISLVAFTIINIGTSKLVVATGKRLPLQAVRLLLIGAIILAVGYCYVTIVTAQTHQPNPYHLPMWLILLTIVVPYLYAWLFGLAAAFEISFYRHHISGLLYKQALSLLAGGLALAITASAILQYINSSSNYLRHLVLDWQFLVAYVVLLVYAAGFLLIAVGANKLKKIEEV